MNRVPRFAAGLVASAALLLLGSPTADAGFTPNSGTTGNGIIDVANGVPWFPPPPVGVDPYLYLYGPANNTQVTRTPINVSGVITVILGEKTTPVDVFLWTFDDGIFWNDYNIESHRRVLAAATTNLDTIRGTFYYTDFKFELQLPTPHLYGQVAYVFATTAESWLNLGDQRAVFVRY